MTMTIKEMKKYISEELQEEHDKMMRGEDNHYSYLFMIANDMGLTENNIITGSYEFERSEEYLEELEEKIQSNLDSYDSDLDVILYRDDTDIMVEVSIYTGRLELGNAIKFGYDVSLVDKYSLNDLAEYIADDIFENIYINE